MTKNYLMNNLYYIRHTPLKNLAISHDMTLKEREQSKKLVVEAKQKEQEEKLGKENSEWGLLEQMKGVN